MAAMKDFFSPLGLLTGGISAILSPSKPPTPAAPPAPSVMPVMDQAAINRSIQQQTLLASATSGRASTILSQTQGTTDKLGG